MKQVKKIKNGLLIIVIFFDEIIFGGNDEASDKFSKKNEEWIWHEHDRRNEVFPKIANCTKKDGLFISKTKYLKDLLKRFGLESCKPIGTPMIISHKLSSKDETPTVEQKKHRSMIGGL